MNLYRTMRARIAFILGCLVPVLAATGPVDISRVLKFINIELILL